MIFILLFDIIHIHIIHWDLVKMHLFIIIIIS